MKRALFLMALVFSSFALQAKALTLEEVVLHLKDAQQRVQGLKAHLLQEKYTAGDSAPVVMEGIIWIKRPDKLRMDIFPPHESITVLEGQQLLIYFPEERVAQRVDLSKDPALARWLQFLQDPLEEVSKRGEIEGTKEGKVIVGLNPSGQFDQFRRIRLWIDEGLWLPVRIEVVEKSGDVTITSYSSIEVNPAFSEDVFQLELPSDVEVVELRGGGSRGSLTSRPPSGTRSRTTQGM